MPLTRKVNAGEFVQAIRKTPRGIVWKNEHHALILRTLEGDDETFFEGPDPLDIEDTEYVTFMSEVYKALADRAPTGDISYLE